MIPAIGVGIIGGTLLFLIVLDRGFPALLLRFGLGCVRLARRMQARHVACYGKAWDELRETQGDPTA